MKKILHVVSSLNINSGVMSVIMNYYRRIDRSLLQFDFMYMEEMSDNHKNEIATLGGKVFYVPYPSFKPSDQKRLRQFFNQHKGEYSAIHCHPIWASELVAREAKRSGITHVIQHSHSTKFSDTKKSEIRNRFLMKFIGFFATDFIACSPEAAYLFGKKRVKNGDVMILPNAINLDLYTFDNELRGKIRDEFGCKDDTILVGNIGRLCPQKNQAFVIDVFRQIHRIIPNSKFLIVGEGALRSDLEKKISDNGLDDIILLTGKRTDIKAILSGLDVFLMPSFFEGAPVAAIEARTSGLPCILSDTITKSIEMDGIVFQSLDVSSQEWAQKTIDYLRGRLEDDRNDCSEIINHGFDIAKTTKQLQNYYLKLS